MTNTKMVPMTMQATNGERVLVREYWEVHSPNEDGVMEVDTSDWETRASARDYIARGKSTFATTYSVVVHVRRYRMVKP